MRPAALYCRYDSAPRGQHIARNCRLQPHIAAGDDCVPRRWLRQHDLPAASESILPEQERLRILGSRNAEGSGQREQH